jgi:hypothetical protein
MMRLEVICMADERTVVVDGRGSSAGPVAGVIGVVVVVAAILLVMFYWHPWSITSTTNSTTVTQPANGSTQKSDTTTNTNTQPH